MVAVGQKKGKKNIRWWLSNLRKREKMWKEQMERKEEKSGCHICKGERRRGKNNKNGEKIGGGGCVL